MQEGMCIINTNGPILSTNGHLLPTWNCLTDKVEVSALLKNRRKHLRHRTDPLDPAIAKFDPLGQPNTWRPVLLADESHSGCRVITIGNLEEVAVGEMIHIAIGNIHSKAEVKRVEILEPMVLSLGCEYTEYPAVVQGLESAIPGIPH